MKTKDKILFTSKELFNLYSANRITTNHIAAELGISPGNLYYHFKNKEEIVRHIWYQQTVELNSIWKTPGFTETEIVIAAVFYQLFEIFYDYRFFYRELPILLDRDPILRKEYSIRTQNILNIWGNIVDSWIDVGILKKFQSEQDRLILVKNTWIIGELWTTYNFLIYDDINESTVREGIFHIFAILKPNFTSKSRKIIQTRLELMIAENK